MEFPLLPRLRFRHSPPSSSSAIDAALMGFPTSSSFRLRRTLTPLFLVALVLGSPFALSSSDFVDPTRVIQLSWRPRAFLYKRFLSDDECEHLIRMAKDKLEESMVADNHSGKSVISGAQTSSGMFLMKRQDAVVAKIEKRISAWTFLSEENAEPMQILHYELGEKYEPNFDYFHDKSNQQIGGYRIATVLMYLSDVLNGGETVFPNAEGKLSQPKNGTWSDGAKNGYAVKPFRGDALLFFSLHPDATIDPTSLHGSCPVVDSEKWSATKWIHLRSFAKSVRKNSGAVCEDENDHCAHWATAGECVKNPLYMIEFNGSRGFVERAECLFIFIVCFRIVCTKILFIVCFRI